MDWNAAIEKNREALKRVLALLVGMADLAGGGATLPRHLHRAVLRLLRPAEAAARRLIVVAARGIVVVLPPPRPRKPDPAAASAELRRLGIAIVVPDRGEALAANGRPAARSASVRAPSLPLVDRLRLPGPPRTRYVPAHKAPRILSLLGDTPPHRLPPPPGPTTRSTRRVSTCACRRWPQRSTICLAMRCASPAGRRGAGLRANRAGSAAPRRSSPAARRHCQNPSAEGGRRMRCTTSCATCTALPAGPWRSPTRHDGFDTITRTICPAPPSPRPRCPRPWRRRLVGPVPCSGRDRPPPA
jgi:hypothetical protein